MMSQPNVTTRNASRQQPSSTPLADDDSVETTIHNPQGTVTLETLHQLILGMHQSLSTLTARVERLEQTRQSPQPHPGNQVTRPLHQTPPETSPPASTTETTRPNGQNGQSIRAGSILPTKRPITAAKDIGFLEPEDDSDTAVRTEGKESVFADVTLFVQRVRKLNSQRTNVLTFLPDTLRGNNASLKFVALSRPSPAKL